MKNVNDNTSTRSTTRGRYVGASAARIAKLIAADQRVRFERGWFWTAASCHDSAQDLMAFRQRPDGDGIDVRCRSAGCPRERIIRRLETITGESIWSAYAAETTPSAPPQTSADLAGEAHGTGSRSWRVALASFIVLLVAAPVVFGYDLQLAALNAVGLVWVGGLARRILICRRRAVAKGGKAH